MINTFKIDVLYKKVKQKGMACVGKAFAQKSINFSSFG